MECQKLGWTLSKYLAGASGSGVGSLLDQRARISLEMVGRALAF